MKFILGKKIGMSQKFEEEGEVIPVTFIQAGPCLVTQVKIKKKEGYEAVQLGFDQKRKLNKPLQGHLKKLDNFRYLKEFLVSQAKNYKRGQKLSVAQFEKGDKVQVQGISKGKGFQGVVKRHGFAGGPASHGHKDQLRMPGSIGSAFPQRVMKGKKMAGRMGGGRVTVKNLEVVEVDLEHNLLTVKGAVPGPDGGLMLISSV